MDGLKLGQPHRHRRQLAPSHANKRRHRMARLAQATAADGRAVWTSQSASGMTPIRTLPVSMDPVDGCPTADWLTFDDVLARCQAEIYRFAVHLARNRAKADDLYQQTLLEAPCAFDRLNGIVPPRA